MSLKRRLNVAAAVSVATPVAGATPAMAFTKNVGGETRDHRTGNATVLGNESSHRTPC